MSLDIQQKIDSRKCEQVREWLKRQKHPDEVADKFDIVPSTVRHHGYGHCACETPIQPAEPQHARITPDECCKIRERAKEDEAYTEIAEEHGVSRHTVGEHARGECTHEVDEEPKDASGLGRNTLVTKEICYNVNRLYWEENCHLDQILEMVRERTDNPPTEKAVRHHIYEDCSHWDDET